MISTTKNPTRRLPCPSTSSQQLHQAQEKREASISIFHPPLRADAMPCDAMQILVHVLFPTSFLTSLSSRTPTSLNTCPYAEHARTTPPYAFPASLWSRSPSKAKMTTSV